MARRKEQFVIGDYYHVYSRGVDKRNIFVGEEDFGRFLRTMREFNNQEPMGGLRMHQFNGDQNKKKLSRSEPLVHII